MSSQVRLKRTMRARRAQHHHQRADGIEHRREQIPLAGERRLRLLELGDVEAHAMDEPGTPVLPPHHLHLALEPDEVAIAGEHPVGRPERVAGQEHLRGLDAPAELVVRMDVVVPADRILQPLRLGEPHDLLDARTHVGLPDAAIEVRHEDHGGHLLDEGPVLGLDVGQWRVGRAGPPSAGEPSRTNTAARLAEDGLGLETAPSCGSSGAHHSVSRRPRRQLGSVFMDAMVKRRSAWIARP